MTDLEAPPFAETFAKPAALIAVPVGLVSPLWGLFAGAALGGSAWWWMTRWARPENLEAMFGAAAEPVLAAPLDAPAAEEAEPAEAAVEVAEAVAPDAPVGGEAAPIAPLVAAVEPRPRVRKAEPKPE